MCVGGGGEGGGKKKGRGGGEVAGEKKCPSEVRFCDNNGGN